LLQAPVTELQAPASWHWSLAAQVIGLEPKQTPAWQLEACVHLSASSQALPLALGLAAQAPVAALQTPTLQASFSAEQSTALPIWHCSVCRLQVSTPLHGLPSSQSPLVLQAQAAELVVQPPNCSEQLSTVHEMPSSHFVAVPPHLPPVHTSEPVQVKPSLQTAPSCLAGLLHEPVLLSQVPAEWQLSLAAHTVWLAGVQVPFWQASPLVHGLPSSHFTPFCLAGLEQTPVAALQTPES
jgi:hypothetical protein